MIPNSQEIRGFIYFVLIFKINCLDLTEIISYITPCLLLIREIRVPFFEINRVQLTDESEKFDKSRGIVVKNPEVDFSPKP
jgi:hypothetical protein